MRFLDLKEEELEVVCSSSKAGLVQDLEAHAREGQSCVCAAYSKSACSLQMLLRASTALGPAHLQEAYMRQLRARCPRGLWRSCPEATPRGQQPPDPPPAALPPAATPVYARVLRWQRMMCWVVRPKFSANCDQQSIAVCRFCLLLHAAADRSCVCGLVLPSSCWCDDG